MSHFTNLILRLFLFILIVSLINCSSYTRVKVPKSAKKTGVSIFDYGVIFDGAVLIDCSNHEFYEKTAIMLENLGFKITKKPLENQILKATVKDVLKSWKAYQTFGRIEIVFNDYHSGTAVLRVEREFSSFKSELAKNISEAFNQTYDDLLKLKRQYIHKNYEKISDQYIKWIKSYVTRENALQIEGIYLTSDNLDEIGIYYDSLSRMCEFKGILLSSRRPDWLPGDIKLCLRKGTTGRFYVGDYILGSKTFTGTTFQFGGDLLMPISGGVTENLIKTFPATSKSESVVQTGSGVLIDSTGLIVTCSHVIRNAKEIKIVHWTSSDSAEARILLNDEINDIAILKTNSVSPKLNISSLDLGYDEEISLGDPVYCVGFPLPDILGTSPRFTDGSITALVGLRDDPRCIQVSAPVQPGNSGAPIFSEEGVLIGIVTSALSEEYVFQATRSLPQNVNFAIKSQYILSLLSNLKDWRKTTGRKVSKSEALDHVVIILCQ